MHWGINPPSKTPPPRFCKAPPIDLQTFQGPLFRQSSLYIGFSWPPIKVGLFSELQKCQSFPFLTPSYLLKVTKFLVKISQFEFLVMTDKNMFAYKLYFLLNISDFSLFFMWKLQPPWKKSPPFSQQPLSKRWDLVKPPNFENLVGGSTCPAEKGVHTMRASHTYHQELVFVMICLREWTIWTIPEDLF